MHAKSPLLGLNLSPWNLKVKETETENPDASDDIKTKSGLAYFHAE
jgi:hypothetical protein